MIRQEPVPTPFPPLTHLRVRPLALSLVVATAVLIALWLPSLIGARWYSDEGVFAAVANAWRDGGTLYADAWDNKPPLIFVTYASAQALFGESLISARALAMLSALGAVAITIIMGTRLYGHARGAVAGLVAAVALGSPIIEGNLALTEVFMILPAAAGMLITITALGRDDARASRMMLAAGICFGLAMGYKQVAIFDLAAAGLLLLLLHPRPLRMVAWLFAGALIPQAAFLFFFAATGAGSGYVFAIAGSMAPYAAAVEDPKPLWASAIGYAPAVITLVYAALNRRSFDLRAFPMIWFALAFAGASSSPYAFSHYLVQAAVPFALVVAGLPLLPRNSSSDVLARTTIALATVAAAIAVFGPEIRERQQSNPQWFYNTALDYTGGKLTRAEYEGRMDGAAYSVEAIAAAIEQDSRGDGLFVWADFPWLYTTTQLQNPTPYATPWLVEWVPGAHADVIADLQANPPAYIVISSGIDNFPALEWLAARDYTLVKQQYDWRLYASAAEPDWAARAH